jgi:radical SAM protein with 4Fe4S-binding SPASM domain
MNIATLIILFLIAVSAKLALKHIYKNGLCVGCPNAKSCPGSCEKTEKMSKKNKKKDDQASSEIEPE